MWFLVVGNAVISLLYFVMPFELLYIYFKRKDFPFRFVFVAIPLFGFWCSAGHMLMMLSFWYPYYYLQAIVDFGTGVVSFGTFIAFIPATFGALKLAGAEKIKMENARLEEEIYGHKSDKARLSQKSKELEQVHSIVRSKNEELSRLNKEMTQQELYMVELKDRIAKAKKTLALKI
jgi:hypothetical protein